MFLAKTLQVIRDMFFFNILSSHDTGHIISCINYFCILSVKHLILDATKKVCSLQRQIETLLKSKYVLRGIFICIVTTQLQAGDVDKAPHVNA